MRPRNDLRTETVSSYHATVMQRRSQIDEILLGAEILVQSVQILLPVTVITGTILGQALQLISDR